MSHKLSIQTLSIILESYNFVYVFNVCNRLKLTHLQQTKSGGDVDRKHWVVTLKQLKSTVTVSSHGTIILTLNTKGKNNTKEGESGREQTEGWVQKK